MDRFVVIKDINKKTMDGIHNEFMKELNIDLDKVSGKSLSEQWEWVLDKCSGEETIRSMEDIICSIDSLTAEALDRPVLLSNNNSVIRSHTVTEIELQNIKDKISKLQHQIYNVYFMDDDVWLNAYFTITFIESQNDDSFYKFDLENGKLFINEKKEYKFPFERYPDSGFCSAYLNTFLSLKGSIFGSEMGPKESIKFEKDGKAKLLMLKDKDYNRWSWQNILKVEKREDYKIEDRVLFNKTVDGILARTILKLILEYNITCEVEDILDFVKTMCGCDSLSWQIIMSFLFVYMMSIQGELLGGRIFEDLYALLTAWTTFIGDINNRLSLLSKGLIYLSYKNGMGYDLKTFEKKCQDGLTRMEDATEFSEADINLIGINQQLRVTNDHKSFQWIYAIMQRSIIEWLRKDKPSALYNEIGDGVEKYKVRLRLTDMEPRKDLNNVLKNMIKREQGRR